MKKVVITVNDRFEDRLFKKLCDGIIARFSECETKKVIDNSIIDGFSVEIDGTVYDYTVKSKLSAVSKFLSE